MSWRISAAVVFGSAMAPFAKTIAASSLIQVSAGEARLVTIGSILSRTRSPLYLMITGNLVLSASVAAVCHLLSTLTTASAKGARRRLATRDELNHEMNLYFDHRNDEDAP